MTPSHTYTLKSADSFTDSALFCDFFTKSCKIRGFGYHCGHEINFASKLFYLFSFKFEIYLYLCIGYQKLSL